MFKGCSSLTSLDLSNFDFTSKYDTYVYEIFDGCSSLNMITLPKSITNEAVGNIILPDVGKSWYAYDEDNFSDLSAKTVLIPKAAAITGSSKGAKLLSTNAIVGVSDTM
ncbi:MAG: hypothetical protein MJ246_02020 [Clostridia bacterium]|nr:hypothetical protein [Clostridia bacterium]